MSSILGVRIQQSEHAPPRATRIKGLGLHELRILDIGHLCLTVGNLHSLKFGCPKLRTIRLSYPCYEGMVKLDQSLGNERPPGLIVDPKLLASYAQPSSTSSSPASTSASTPASSSSSSAQSSVPSWSSMSSASLYLPQPSLLSVHASSSQSLTVLQSSSTVSSSSLPTNTAPIVQSQPATSTQPAPQTALQHQWPWSFDAFAGLDPLFDPTFHMHVAAATGALTPNPLFIQSAATGTLTPNPLFTQSAALGLPQNQIPPGPVSVPTGPVSSPTVLASSLLPGPAVTPATPLLAQVSAAPVAPPQQHPPVASTVQPQPGPANAPPAHRSLALNDLTFLLDSPATARVNGVDEFVAADGCRYVKRHFFLRTEFYNMCKEHSINL